MAVLLPKGADGFRITDTFYSIEEPINSIASSFYVKAASIPIFIAR